jgi:hypothetical protein
MRFIAVAMLLVGCGGGGAAVLDPDASPDARSGCGDCDAPGPDASTTVCSALTYDTRAVKSVELFEDGGRINASRSFRVAIGYDATPCDQLAMPTWRVVPANHVVDIDANVFAPRGVCPGLPIRRTRVITLRLDAGAWRLIGAGAATPPQLMVTVGPAPLVPCAPDGGGCLQDCDCVGGEVCIGASGIGGPVLQCGRPCELDRDCGGGQCTSITDGLQLACDASVAECGGPGQGCPDGFTCASGACAPDFVLSSTTRHECACDADCAEPFRCVEPSVPGRVARCEIPCPSGGGWCQGPHACGPASADVSGLAPTDSLCGWAGE